MSKLKLGFGFTGSFCTFKDNIKLMKALSKDYEIIPIMSFNASSIDTRFGKADDFINQMEEISGNKVIRTIQDAEPIGPTKMTDVMLVSPCTGNTLAKLANSIVDTPITMAVKSHLRNNLPVILAVSTNDALSGAMKNIGLLSNTRNYYFIPMGQDNHKGKPTSLVADFELASLTINSALDNKQIQPLMLAPYLDNK